MTIMISNIETGQERFSITLIERAIRSPILVSAFKGKLSDSYEHLSRIDKRYFIGSYNGDLQRGSYDMDKKWDIERKSDLHFGPGDKIAYVDYKDNKVIISGEIKHIAKTPIKKKDDYPALPRGRYADIRELEGARL